MDKFGTFSCSPMAKIEKEKQKYHHNGRFILNLQLQYLCTI